MADMMSPIVRKVMEDALQMRLRVRRRDGWRRDPWLIIDDESRRRDEALARKIRDWKLRYRESGNCRLVFEMLGQDAMHLMRRVEDSLTSRKLVRDFFTRRASALRARAL
jgi:hypothetical protein